MPKKLLLALAAGTLALTLALAGCGNQESSSRNSSENAASDQPASDTGVGYCTHPEKMLTALADEFTAETGINVEFVNLKGELADRVRSEKANPQADIMYGGDISIYLQLAEDGCFAQTTPTWANELPSDYKGANGDWYATIKTPVMMFYNTTELDAASAPKDWSDLTDSAYQGKIVARDYISSSMRAAVCNLIYFNEQEGGESAAMNYLKGLDANIKNYYNSGSMMFKAIGNGEAAIGISTMNDIIDNRDNNGMPLQYINAESGEVIVCDCVAAINNAPHADAAAKFLEFVGSKDTEAMLANEFNRMPALDSALTDSPDWMKADIKTLPANWSVIAENQTQWLDDWQNTIYSDDKTVASK